MFFSRPNFVLPAEPWTISIAAKRTLLAARVFANAVPAGTMASRSGTATVAPMPRNTVRREMCFFVMNMGGGSSDCRSLRSVVVLVRSAVSAALIWNAALLTTLRKKADMR